MDLRQLRQFVAIAEERSFRRAAERLHMSQPPLSVSVQRLEADIGVTLLDRTRHHVRLTLAGDAFLNEARRTLAHAQLSIEIAQRTASGKLGSLRLSFVPSAAIDVVPQLLREFRKDHADVKLVLSGDTTSQQIAGLLSGTGDIGIVVPPLDDFKDLKVQLFCMQELMLAVPRDHALGNQSRVQLKNLANETFVGFPFKEGPGFESVVMTACQENGFTPTFVQVASQMQSILAFVAGSLGVALVPQSMQAIAMENVHYVQVRSGRQAIQYSLGLAYKASNDNPAVAAFLATAHRLGSRHF